MRIRNFAAAAALGIAALALSACATGLNTKVTRYQAASIPAGTSFYVVPKQGTATPQFYRYASMLTQQLEARGYRPAGAPQAADVLVKVDYGVDEGQPQYNQDPYYGPYGFGPYGYGSPIRDSFWRSYYGIPYYSRWSRYPYYYGWDDPFYSSAYGYGGYGGFGPYGGYGMREYIIYKSYLDMDIVQRGTNAPLFEGHAKARSQTDELDALVPNLIQAMFTGFPGRNGETVKITVPARRS